MKKCPPYLNIVLTLRCEMKHHISYFYNALLTSSPAASNMV